MSKKIRVMWKGSELFSEIMVSNAFVINANFGAQLYQEFKERNETCHNLDFKLYEAMLGMKWAEYSRLN